MFDIKLVCFDLKKIDAPFKNNLIIHAGYWGKKLNKENDILVMMLIKCTMFHAMLFVAMFHPAARKARGLGRISFHFKPQVENGGHKY